jgi:hypothetical protein
MFVYMCASLAPEWLDSFYSCSEFKCLSVISGSQVNTKFPITKTRAFEILVPKYKMLAISKSALKDIAYKSVIYGECVPK